MAKYLLAYTGGSMPETEEQQAAVMAAWEKWFGPRGAAVADPGTPFGPSATIAADGGTSDGGAARLTGYSIISADSLGEAVGLAKDCPVRTGGGSVEVYEVFDVM